MYLPLGETAALITAACYTASSTFFTRAGQQFGSWVTNRARLLVAVILLVLVHWIFLGQPLPLDAAPERWLWLGASGIVGLVLGDLFLFQAYIWIGPRLGLLLLSLAPVLAAVLAWLFLGEVLSPLDGLGMAATLGGIAWVVLQPRGQGESQPRQVNYLSGLLAGFLAAAGQAGGLVLAKKGLGGDFSALSANVMRMSIALLALVDTHPAAGADPRDHPPPPRPPHRVEIHPGRLRDRSPGRRVALLIRHPAHQRGHRQHADRPAAGLLPAGGLFCVQRTLWLGRRRRHAAGTCRGGGPVPVLIYNTPIHAHQL